MHSRRRLWISVLVMVIILEAAIWYISMTKSSYSMAHLLIMLGFFDTYVQWLFNNNPGTQHARIHIHTHNSHVQGRQDIFNVCSKNCNLRFGILLLKISRIEVLGFSMSWNAHKWVPLSSQPMWNIGGWCGRFSVAVIWQMKSKLLQR